MPESRTLGGLVAELARRCPDREAVVANGARITYRELHERVQEVARGLLALGVGRDDKVACWLPNQVEWIVTKLAVTSIGGVLVALNTWYRAHELEYVLTHSEAKALVMTPRLGRNDYFGILRELVPEIDTAAAGELSPAAVPALRHVICVDNDGSAPACAGSLDELVTRGRTVSDDALRSAIDAVTPDLPADLLYTSGSTARPKGVVLLHGGLIENGFNIGARQHVVEGDRLWLANPLFFSYGCANALMVALSHAATIVLQRTFEPGEGLRLIEAERCTVLYGTTNMVLAMLDHPDRPRRDISSLRTGTGTGNPGHIRARIELGATKICNSYGLTETYGHCADSDADMPEEVRLNASGRPLPGNEIRITDIETGRPLGPNEPGEIRVRGYVTPGYYKAPELNAKAFDDDGFFRTGDQGILDEDGQVHWQARLTEMIKTGGINVAPSEVELVLGEHPEVQTSCVFALPDPVKDQIVAAVVALKPGATADAEDLTAFCRERMAGYKVPSRVELARVADLPLTPTGKVWRKELQRRLAEGENVSGAEARR